jgi:twitching motility protein PilT
VSVSPRGDRWSVQIEATAGAPVAPTSSAGSAPVIARAPSSPAIDAADGDEMLIERTAHGSRGASWLDERIRDARGVGATDLHLVPGTRAIARAGHELVAIGDAAAIDSELLARELETALPGAIEETEKGRARLHGYVVDGVARCRVHVFRDRHGIGASLRLHPLELPEPRRLGLPDAALALGARRHGLVLVASPAGGGRTTTLGALVEQALARAARVVSIERAAELVHGHRRGLISQRVIGDHAPTVADALGALADEQVDVIAVHDLPDAPSVAAALALARAGRLVLAGIAAGNAADALDHVIAHAGGPRVAAVLAGAIAQVLCRRSGGGLVAAFEVVAAGEDLLAAVRQAPPHGLTEWVARGPGSLAAALAELVRARAISLDEAVANAPDPAGLRALLGV